MESCRHTPLPLTSPDIQAVKEFIGGKGRICLNTLLFSSVYVGLAGAGIVYLAALFQTITLYPWQLTIPFCIIFAVYNLNRKTDEVEDEINRHDRFTFTTRYQKGLFCAALLAYGYVFIISAIYGAWALAVVTLPLLAGILYSVPVLPSFITYRRLKEIPVVKNVMVSLSWALTLTLIPPAFTLRPLGFDTLITFFFFLNWAIVASILPDIRDREGDERAGIVTIPVLLGDDRTLTCLGFLNCCCGLAVMVAGGGAFPLLTAVLIGLSVGYLALCIHSFHNPLWRDTICDLLTDGQFLFISIGVAVMSAVL